MDLSHQGPGTLQEDTRTQQYTANIRHQSSSVGEVVLCHRLAATDTTGETPQPYAEAGFMPKRQGCFMLN